MENYFKSVFGAYDGLHTDTFKHIPEISYYNHNYYIGLKRENNAIHDLLFAESDDDNLTEWYIVLGNCVRHIGYEFSDKGVINLSDEQLWRKIVLHAYMGKYTKIAEVWQ